ncbi:MAG: LysM peptidoglycan-binding domain-containing protein [Chloroflexi bacterium]|nr:LysM peptidoglycan-binding domain-containing protein [Chloroflexota bacterium]
MSDTMEAVEWSEDHEWEGPEHARREEDRARGTHSGHRLGRRRFLGGLTAVAGTALAALAPEGWETAVAEASPRPETSPRPPGPAEHMAWVWHFGDDDGDGTPEALRAKLAAHRMSVAVKTHDGTEWMSRYDRTPHSVTGPPRIAQLARFFEEGGVPFHAWCVVKGRQPIREAAMAAAALSAGARSIIIDLEPYDLFWTGTRADALAFGRELRRLHPRGWIQTSIDPRPWNLDPCPMAEFATFSDVLVPQLYWDLFNTRSNHRLFAEYGFPLGPEGVTPAFLLDMTARLLGKYKLPIHPAGQGDVRDVGAWRDFIRGALSRGMEAVSVWRADNTPTEVYRSLVDNPAHQEEIYSSRVYRPQFDEEVSLPEPMETTHMVQPGDRLEILAKRWGSSPRQIADHNGMGNPDLIKIGQVLRIPPRVS